MLSKGAAPPLLIRYKSQLDLELDHLEDFQMQKWITFRDLKWLK
jgi:hypothetical protein